MATKILIRSGTNPQLAAMILEVAEPAFITDTKDFVVGDGSSNPPRFMSTKSNQSYNYSATDTVTFNKLVANSFNGINLGQLNAANGYLVRTGQGAFASRTMTSNNNSLIISNPDGGLGNTDFKVSPNLDLSSGTQGIILPHGTTDVSQRGANIPGKLRYAVNPNDPYRTPEIYSFDNEWRAIKEYVYQGDHVLTVGSEFPTLQLCIQRHLLVDTAGENIINIPAGVLNVGNQIDFVHKGDTSSWAISGVAPLVKNLTAIHSITGSTGAWNVTFAMDDVSNVNVGNYMLVDSLRGYSPMPIRGFSASFQGSQNLNSYGNYSTLDCQPNYIYDLHVNDYISLIPDAKTDGLDVSTTRFYTKVAQIPASTALVMQTPAPFSTTFSVVYSYFGSTGVMYVNSADPTNVIGVGTSFTTELNVGDTITINNDIRKVGAIISNTSLTLTTPNSCWPISSGTAVIGYINNNPELHCGTWQITAVDTVNKYVTVTNKSAKLLPLNKIGSGTCKILKSVINFTNPADDGFYLDGNSRVRFQNVVILSGSGTGGVGITVESSAASLFDVAIIGFNGYGGIVAERNSFVYTGDSSTTLSISNCGTGLRLTNGAFLVSLSQTLINGCYSYGVVLINNAKLACYYLPNTSWKAPFAVTECNTCFYATANSDFACHLAMCAYSTANCIQCVKGYFYCLMCIVIHDVSAGYGLFGGMNSSIQALYSKFYSIFLTAVVVLQQTYIDISNSTFSNNNSSIQGSTGSFIHATYCWLVSSFGLHIYLTDRSTLMLSNGRARNCGPSVSGTNPGTAGGNNVNIYIVLGSYANLGNVDFVAPNSSYVQISGLLMSTIYATGATYAGSTTISPAANTVANQNSYISV